MTIRPSDEFNSNCLEPISPIPTPEEEDEAERLLQVLLSQAPNDAIHPGPVMEDLFAPQQEH